MAVYNIPPIYLNSWDFLISMEYDFDQEEFFLDGVQVSLIKAFNIENRSIFCPEFEKTFIKDVYLKKIPALKKILKEKTSKNEDSFLQEAIKELSAKLISKFEKEIDSETVKANLSPKTSSNKLDKSSARINLSKLKLMNEVYLCLLKKGNTEEFRKSTSSLLQCLSRDLLLNDSSITESKYLNQYIYQIAGIEKEENNEIREIIEEIILCHLELDCLVEELRNIIKNKRKFYPFSFFRQMNIENKSNINLLSNKRKSSVDKPDLSPQRDLDKNFKLEKYFKPLHKAESKDTKHHDEKKYTFKSSILDPKLNLASKFDQYANCEQVNINPSDVSYATFAEKSKSTPAELSLSKQSSILYCNNSNSVPFSVYENSRTLNETISIKRPLKFSTPAFYNTAAKSSVSSNLNYSVSEFSNDVLMSSLNKFDMDLNSQLSVTSRKGINSLLATRKKEISTKKTPHLRLSSNKKRKQRDGLFDKYSRSKNGSNNKIKPRNENYNNLNIPKEEEKLKFKKIMKKEFYQNLKYIDKSPDVLEQKALEAVQGKTTAESKKKNSKPNSRSLSVTDDEVLVYQTPVKSGIIKKSGGASPSPITTRKNLFNLFNQTGHL